MPTLLTPTGTREGGIRASYDKGFITREEDYHFVVQADDLQQARSEILFSTAGLPVIGQTVFNGMLCKGATGDRQKDHGLRWDAVFTFSNAVDEDDNQQQNTGDPQLWVPIRRTMFERIEEIMTKDASGTRIATSAGQPFDTGISIGRHLPLWEFTQWESIGVSDFDIIGRNETVNTSSIWGGAAKTWLLKVVDSVVGFYFGYRCRMTTYRVIYNYKKWTQKRLDVGTVYKSGSDLLPFLDKAGNVILGALDGSGAKQTVGTAPAELEFDIFPTSSFSFIRLA